MAHLVVFTGRTDFASLSTMCATSWAKEEANKETKEEKRSQRAKKIRARSDFNYAMKLEAGIKKGKLREEELGDEGRELIEKLRSGALREAINNAVLEFGHGRVTKPDGTDCDIGGSSGGRVRATIRGMARSASRGPPLTRMRSRSCRSGSSNGSSDAA